jgi:hypothetical protein
MPGAGAGGGGRRTRGGGGRGRGPPCAVQAGPLEARPAALRVGISTMRGRPPRRGYGSAAAATPSRRLPQRRPTPGENGERRGRPGRAGPGRAKRGEDPGGSRAGRKH